jgi:tRNA (guanine37-N1)-methyltransferase
MTRRISVITLFPNLFPGPLGESVLGSALQKGLWSLQTLQLRDFATDKHRTVDDTPYGGGAGMVLKPDVVDAAIHAAKAGNPAARLLYMSPRGALLTQQKAAELAQNDLIILCGRYEGVDERVLKHHQIEEISIGDYVLAGGEVAAMALLEATLRLIPGVLGAAESAAEESFATGSNYAGLLEYPHYTKPPFWNGLAVPDVLLSGHHQNIAEWRLAQAEELTRERRPDIASRHPRGKETKE